MHHVWLTGFLLQDKTQRRCPDWQVFIDGCWRCQPCNKMIDEQCLGSELW